MLRQHTSKGVRRFGMLAALAALIAFALVGAWGSAPQSAYAGPPERRGSGLEPQRGQRARQRADRRDFRERGQSPPVSMLHLAMVQGAVYDAVNMIDGGYQPYLAGLPSAPGSASKARRSRRPLITFWSEQSIVPPLSGDHRYPTQTPSTRQLASRTHAVHGRAPRRYSAGVAAGAAARARRCLTDRANDGRYPAVPFMFAVGDDPGTSGGPTARRRERPVRLGREGRPLPARERRRRSGPKGPHALKSGAYAKDYNEVKALRRERRDDAQPSGRQEQTDTARFFAEQSRRSCSTHVRARYRRQSGSDDGGAGPALRDAQHGSGGRS